VELTTSQHTVDHLEVVLAANRSTLD